MVWYARKQVAFADRQTCARTVEFLVGRVVTRKKAAVIGFGVPAIDSEEMMWTGNIAEKPCATVMRVTLEQLCQRPLRAIDSLKAFLTSLLDFQLPEDYKHRCPIFRSRILAFQHNFIRGSLVC
jgi:hypothetical protein